MTKIATLADPKTWKVDTGIATFLAALGGGATLIITTILFWTGLVALPHVFIFSLGAAVGMPIIGMLLGVWGARSDRALAKDEIEEAIKGFADSSFTPTKEQYKRLFRAGTPIPFEVNGISGAKITRSTQREWDNKTNEELPATYSFNIEAEVIDDGTENFDRMLKRAIESNTDIKAAAVRA